MNNENKKRISPKIFSRFKYTGEKAQEFIKKHWDYIKSHDFLEPIIEAYEAEEIDHGSALFAFQEALLDYQHQYDFLKAQEAIKKSIERSSQIKPPSSAYTITIYVNGTNGIEIGKEIIKHQEEDEETGKVIHWEEEKELIFSAPLFQFAQRKAYNVLCKREDSVHAEVVNNFGKSIMTVISRTDAFANMFPRAQSPATKNLSKKNAPLKNYPKVKNDRAIGPWSIKH